MHPHGCVIGIYSKRKGIFRKYRYHLSITPVFNEKYIFETWFEEVRDCLRETNIVILEREVVLESKKH